jgi:hypothetical protein
MFETSGYLFEGKEEDQKNLGMWFGDVKGRISSSQMVLLDESRSGGDGNPSELVHLLETYMQEVGIRS